MLQHPGLPTVSLFDVPRSVAQHLWHTADLSYHYSRFGDRLSHTPRWSLLCELLGVDFTTRVDESSHEHQERLLNEVLGHLALLNTHTVLVVQYFGELEAGCMCLMDHCHLPSVQRHLERYGWSGRP